MKRVTVVNGSGLRNLPARCPAELAAEMLGFRTEDISVLVGQKLLKPLGHPPRSGTKYFATVILQELASDPAWLAKASDAIVRFWEVKNRRRGSMKASHCGENGAVSHSKRSF